MKQQENKLAAQAWQARHLARAISMGLAVAGVVACNGSASLPVGNESLAASQNNAIGETPTPSGSPTAAAFDPSFDLTMTAATALKPWEAMLSDVVLLSKISGSSLLLAKKDGSGRLFDETTSTLSEVKPAAAKPADGVMLSMAPKEFWILTPAFIGRSADKEGTEAIEMQRVGIEALRGSEESLTAIGVAPDFLITKSSGKLQIFRFYKDRVNHDPNAPTPAPGERPIQVLQIDWPPKSVEQATSQNAISAGLLEGSASLWVATSDGIWLLEAKNTDKGTSFSSLKYPLKIEGLGAVPKSLGLWLSLADPRTLIGGAFALTEQALFASAPPPVPSPTANASASPMAKLAFADIQPIVTRSCANCHGGHYATEAQWKAGKAAVQARLNNSALPMPPNEASAAQKLTADEKAKLLKWVSDN